MSEAFVTVLQSLLRTIVPALVGAVVSFFASKGFEVDKDLEGALTALIFLVVLAVYYFIVRLLETYVSPKFGLLLGLAKSPAIYTKPSPLDKGADIEASAELLGVSQAAVRRVVNRS